MTELVWIRMRDSISGGRPDGSAWPPAGTLIQVEDWEAEHNVRAKIAEYAEAPEPPAPESRLPGRRRP